MHLAIEGGKEPLALLILPFQTRQHQGQEGLLAQKGHAGVEKQRKKEQDRGLAIWELPTSFPLLPSDFPLFHAF